MIHIRHFKFCWLIGFGYWVDKYDAKLGFKGEVINILLPFIRIQFGTIERCDEFQALKDELINFDWQLN